MPPKEGRVVVPGDQDNSSDESWLTVRTVHPLTSLDGYAVACYLPDFDESDYADERDFRRALERDGWTIHVKPPRANLLVGDDYDEE